MGTYDAAGFPYYDISSDGYPVTTDVDRRMLIGYAANSDRNEDWMTNPLPIRDSQQPFYNTAPLTTHPASPTARDAGGFAVTGQVPGSSAVHTASDIPVAAMGPGAGLFTGVMDNTDVFFKAMQAVLVGAGSDYTQTAVGQRTATDRLVNLSNRGLVGTGENVLISGFVINGSRNREVLIRALGPALSAFGVSNPLTDPVLKIYNASGALVASNDNWEVGNNLASLQTTTSSIGARALTAGSKDAALVVTLPAGAYTAQIEGTSATPGIALLEVYEAL